MESQPPDLELIFSTNAAMALRICEIHQASATTPHFLSCWRIDVTDAGNVEQVHLTGPAAEKFLKERPGTNYSPDLLMVGRD